MSYISTVLNKQHHKSDFNCGHEALNTYLHQRAGQDMKRKLAACFVLANEEQRIMAYYTLSAASVSAKDLPLTIQAKLPLSYTYIPATLLGRLAVDKAYQGKDFGEMLLLDAMKRSLYNATNNIGSFALIVDPIDTAAAEFYARYGFIPLPDNGKMFIAMNTITLLNL
jgi:ribosomal protein S18 acetylase RimI-like enzyme